MNLASRARNRKMSSSILQALVCSHHVTTLQGTKYPGFSHQRLVLFFLTVSNRIAQYIFFLLLFPLNFVSPRVILSFTFSSYSCLKKIVKQCEFSCLCWIVTGLSYFYWLKTSRKLPVSHLPTQISILLSFKALYPNYES